MRNWAKGGGQPLIGTRLSLFGVISCAASTQAWIYAPIVTLWIPHLYLIRCVSENVCKDVCICKILENIGHTLPHTLGDKRSVSLTTGAGQVSTLLADVDWLFPSFPSSQSAADLRRWFNHSWYGIIAQHATQHPLYTVISTSTPSQSLTPLSQSCTLAYITSFYKHKRSVHNWSDPAGTYSKYKVRKCCQTPFWCKRITKNVINKNSWGHVCMWVFVCLSRLPVWGKKISALLFYPRN